MCIRDSLPSATPERPGPSPTGPPAVSPVAPARSSGASSRCWAAPTTPTSAPCATTPEATRSPRPSDWATSPTATASMERPARKTSGRLSSSSSLAPTKGRPIRSPSPTCCETGSAPVRGSWWSIREAPPPPGRRTSGWRPSRIPTSHSPSACCTTSSPPTATTRPSSTAGCSASTSCAAISWPRAAPLSGPPASPACLPRPSSSWPSTTRPLDLPPSSVMPASPTSSERSTLTGRSRCSPRSPATSAFPVAGATSCTTPGLVA